MLDAIVVDAVSKTIRPTHSLADEFFGVAWGTNGTAAECRRTLVGQDGFKWVTSDGRDPAWLGWYK